MKSTMMETLDGIIKQARGQCGNPNSVPALQHEILADKSLRQRMHRTRGLRVYLLAVGLANAIRAFLKKRADDDAEGASKDQLELWPKKLRDLVGEIDCARVFVPSREQFVELDPASITPAECKEAGSYLITKGRDCINRGNKLLRLAKERW